MNIQLRSRKHSGWNSPPQTEHSDIRLADLILQSEKRELHGKFFRRKYFLPFQQNSTGCTKGFVIVSELFDREPRRELRRLEEGTPDERLEMDCDVDLLRPFDLTFELDVNFDVRELRFFDVDDDEYDLASDCFEDAELLADLTDDEVERDCECTRTLCFVFLEVSVSAFEVFAWSLRFDV